MSKDSRATNRIRKAIERGGPNAMALISALSIETGPGGVLYDGEAGAVKANLAYSFGHLLARNPKQWESVIKNAAPIKIRIIRNHVCGNDSIVCDRCRPASGSTTSDRVEFAERSIQISPSDYYL